jgi:hypothetical protein
VSHGVADAQEGVGKRHASNGGSVVHCLACDRVCDGLQETEQVVLWVHAAGDGLIDVKSYCGLAAATLPAAV